MVSGNARRNTESMSKTALEKKRLSLSFGIVLFFASFIARKKSFGRRRKRSTGLFMEQNIKGNIFRVTGKKREKKRDRKKQGQVDQRGVLNE